MALKPSTSSATTVIDDVVTSLTAISHPARFRTPVSGSVWDASMSALVTDPNASAAPTIATTKTR